MRVTRQRPVIPDNTRIQRLRLTVMLGWIAAHFTDSAFVAGLMGGTCLPIGYG